MNEDKKINKLRKLTWIIIIGMFLLFPILATLLGVYSVIIFLLAIIALFVITAIVNKYDKNQLESKYNLSNVENTSNQYSENLENIVSLNHYQPYQKNLKYLEQELIPKIQINNPSFSKATFKQQIINIFNNVILIQTEKDIDKLKAFETQELLKKHIQKIKDNNEAKIIPVIKEISVVSAFITDYTTINNQEAIKMQLTVKYKGNNNEQNININDYILSTFYLEFIKNNENNNENNNAINCPNCGAAANLNISSRCEYCNSFIPPINNQWLLNKLSYWDEQNNMNGGI